MPTTSQVQEEYPVRCPYCGSTFNEVEKYHNYFLYRWHSYDHIFSLPFENSRIVFSPLAFLPKIKFDQRDTVECNNCKRNFTLLLFPYEINSENKREYKTIYDQVKNSDTEFSCQTPLSRLNFLFSKNSDIGTIFRSFFFLFVFNLCVFFFLILFYFIDLSKTAQFILLICSLTIVQAFFILLDQKQSRFYIIFFDPDKSPFLIASNYKKSESFSIFRKIICRSKNFMNISRILSLTLLPIILVMAFFMFLPITGLTAPQFVVALFNQNFQAIFIASLLLFLFWALLIFLSVIGLFFISIIVLAIMTRSIPVRILPWKESMGLKTFENFHTSVITFSFMISVLLPILLNLFDLLKATNDFIFAHDKIAILANLLKSDLFLKTISMSILVLSIAAFIVIIVSLNISRRKSEQMDEISEKILAINNQPTMSIHDQSSLLTLQQEYTQIKEMSIYPINKTVLIFAGIIIYAIPILIGIFF